MTAQSPVDSAASAAFTLRRILAAPVDAYLLPVTGFPIPQPELDTVKIFLQRFVAQAIASWQLTLDVFIQFENLELAGGSARFSEKGRFWLPKLGLGVWPSRPAPTLWTRADFQDLDVGEKPRPLMYKVFRLSTPEGRGQAPDIMLGRGTVMHVLVEGDPERFLKGGRETLLPVIQEQALRGFAFHVPLLDVNSLKEAKDGDLEKWLCGASIYVRESPEDRGILMLSERPLNQILAALGGDPAPDEKRVGFPLIMFPSSAVQVIEQTADRLVVSDPPYYTVGWCLILLALSAMGFRFFVSGASTPVWPVLLVAAPFLIAGLGLLTSRTTFSFYRSGIVNVDRRTFGIPRSTQQVPLRDIRSATVETGRNSRRLVLVLASGGVVPIGSLTSQQGDYKAAASINDFLKQQIPR